MIFNLKMYEPKKSYAIVKSVGYESVLTHSHDFIEIVYVENGTAVQKLNYETINLKSNKKAKSLSELKVKASTVIKVSGETITEYYENDEIKDKLNK